MPHPPLLTQVTCYNLDWLGTYYKDHIEFKLGHISDFLSQVPGLQVNVTMSQTIRITTASCGGHKQLDS